MTIHPDELIIKPLSEAETIPAEWYTHPDMQPLEKEAVYHFQNLLKSAFVGKI